MGSLKVDWFRRIFESPSKYFVQAPSTTIEFVGWLIEISLLLYGIIVGIFSVPWSESESITKTVLKKRDRSTKVISLLRDQQTNSKSSKTSHDARRNPRSRIWRCDVCPRGGPGESSAHKAPRSEQPTSSSPSSSPWRNTCKAHRPPTSSAFAVKFKIRTRSPNKTVFMVEPSASSLSANLD